MALEKAATRPAELDWSEVLAEAFQSGFQSPFNMEWLIDKAERREWNEKWW